MNDPSKRQAEAPFARPTGVASGMRPVLVLFLGLLVLGVVVFVVYYPGMRAPFIFDDSVTIVENRAIRQLWPLVGSGADAGPLNSPKETPIHGRPIVGLSFAVNYYFGGLDPFGYRIVNMVFHFFSALLLWRIVSRTLRLEFFQDRFARVAEAVSFGAAIVWALHPVNTESVVYVTQRTELMMGMFYLATLYFSILYWAMSTMPARVVCLVLATASCVLGMLCKEMMASAPAMVLFYERTFISGSFRRSLRRSWPLYVALSLTWVPLLALNLGGARTPAAGFGQGVDAYEWWLTQAKVLFLYLKLAVWPWPLVIHYEIPHLKTVTEAWPWLLGAGLLVLGTVVLFWRRRASGFVAVWFFAVLSPTLVVPLITETAAERRMYVPLAALVPLLVVGGYVVLRQSRRFVARRTKRKSTGYVPTAVFSAAMIAVLFGCGYLTSLRLTAYRDELTLWRDAIKYQPHDPVVRQNLGIQFARAGQIPEAIVHLEEAVRFAPGSRQGHYNLALALEQSGRVQEAVEHYRATLRVCPDDPASHYNLGRLLANAGQLEEAVEHCRQAIAAQPDFPAAHANLGILLMMSGENREAVGHFESAVRGEASLTNFMNLAWAYAQVNRMADAIATAEKALDLARDEGETKLSREIEATFEIVPTARGLALGRG